MRVEVVRWWSLCRPLAVWREVLGYSVGSGWLPVLWRLLESSEEDEEDGGEGSGFWPVETSRQVGVESSAGTIPLMLSLNSVLVLTGLPSFAQ